VILDPNVVFPRRPGKVTVAPRRTIAERSEELKAYFRAIIRTFWLMGHVKNFDYLHDLEARFRKLTHNEDEQRLFIASAPDRVDSWALRWTAALSGPRWNESLERWSKEAGWSVQFPSETYSKTTPCGILIAMSAPAEG
jgi:hypothetical protein